MSDKYIEVPIVATKAIARTYGKDQVIIIAYDKKHNKTHVTTYGHSITDSAQAGEAGNKLKKALGWPDQRCHDEPERIRILKKAIGRFKAIVEGQECACEESYKCTVHDDLRLADEAIMVLLGMDDIVVKARIGAKNTLIVDDCPYCHQRHFHGGGGHKMPEISGLRVADCGGGQYRLVE